MKTMKKRHQGIKDFAAAVGLKIRIEPQEDGSKDLILYDAKGEPLCTEFDTNDMAESIGVYAGSHQKFESAKETWESTQ